MLKNEWLEERDQERRLFLSDAFIFLLHKCIYRWLEHGEDMETTFQREVKKLREVL
jgi:hypothetical protein